MEIQVVKQEAIALDTTDCARFKHPDYDSNMVLNLSQA
jgi:hypothetical protein